MYKVVFPGEDGGVLGLERFAQRKISVTRIQSH
jgi:hypothetical protein